MFGTQTRFFKMQISLYHFCELGYSNFALKNLAEAAERPPSAEGCRKEIHTA